MERVIPLIVIVFFAAAVSAQVPAQVLLSKYYAAKCEDYTGTWQGFMTDPQDLFDEGGPWKTKVSLFHKDGFIIGELVSQNKKTKLWAKCHEGILSDIFYGNKNQCGHFSQQGLLFSKNAIVLKLNYENAMNGTEFVVFLERINRHYALAKPKQLSEYALGEIVSCH